MSTLKSAMRLDGQVLSNNDPDMVITLIGADAAKVAITEKGDDTITYSFLESVDVDTLYSLSLSFVYKNLYKYVQPLKLTNTVIVPDVVVTDAPISTECWARGETLPFKVSVDGEDVTDTIIDVAFTPKSIVRAGNSGARSWTIESEQEFGKTSFKVDYTYRLPGDEEGTSRVASGTFNIAAYDGNEIFVTPMFDKFEMPIDTDTKFKFKVKLRNLAKPIDSVRYLQDIANTGMVKHVKQELVGTDELDVTFNCPSILKESHDLPFGGNGTNSVLGKNRVDLPTEMRTYKAGLVMTKRTPAVLEGKQGEQITQEFLTNYDGILVNPTVVSSNEAILKVIGVVDNVITYEVTADPKDGAERAVILTYSYNDDSKQIDQYVNIKTPLKGQWNSIDELTPAIANQVSFDIIDGEGKFVPGATLKSFKAVNNPNSGFVSPGHSNPVETLDDYIFELNAGHIKGTVTVDIVMTVNGEDVVIPQKVFTNPGTDLVVTSDVKEVKLSNGTTPITLTFKQDIFGEEGALVEGSVKTISASNGTLGEVELPAALVDGQLVVNFTGAEMGEHTLTGTVIAPANVGNEFPRDWSVSFMVIDDVVLAVADNKLNTSEANTVKFSLATATKGDAVTTPANITIGHDAPLMVDVTTDVRKTEVPGEYEIDIHTNTNVGPFNIWFDLKEKGVHVTTNKVELNIVAGELKIVQIPDGIYGLEGKTSTLKYKLEYNGVPIPADDTGVSLTLTNQLTPMTVASITGEAAVINLLVVPVEEIQAYFGKAQFSYKGAAASHDIFMVRVRTKETKPEVVVSIEDPIKDLSRGKLIGTINGAEEPDQDKFIMYTVDQSLGKWFKVYTNGNWECSKPISEPESHVGKLEFDLNHGGIRWSYTQDLNINIIPRVLEIKNVNFPAIDIWESVTPTSEVLLDGKDVTSYINSVQVTNPEALEGKVEITNPTGKEITFKAIWADPEKDTVIPVTFRAGYVSDEFSYTADRTADLVIKKRPADVPAERFSVSLD